MTTTPLVLYRGRCHSCSYRPSLTPDIPDMTRGFTGQYRDDTGLLYYGARYYDPQLARFVSADSLVPGRASGQGGMAATLGQDAGAALRPLAVDFHETAFSAGLAAEDAFTQARGFRFQLSDRDRQRAKVETGPGNPQALNRYSYVLNNPLRYTDPTGRDLDTLLEIVAAVAALFVTAVVAPEALYALFEALELVAEYFTVECAASRYCLNALAGVVYDAGTNYDTVEFAERVGRVVETCVIQGCGALLAANGIELTIHVLQRLQTRFLTTRSRKVRSSPLIYVAEATQITTGEVGGTIKDQGRSWLSMLMA